MEENVIQFKSGIIINVNVSVNIYVKKFMFGIQLHVVAISNYYWQLNDYM